VAAPVSGRPGAGRPRCAGRQGADRCGQSRHRRSDWWLFDPGSGLGQEGHGPARALHV